MKTALPPIWVESLEALNADIEKVEGNIKKLKRLHQERLKVSFVDEDEAAQDRTIEVLTQEITRVFRGCEQRLKKIATVGNVTKLPYEERLVRLNVMRSKATKVQELSREFRHVQKDFLQELQRQAKQNDGFFKDDGGDDEIDGLTFEAIDKGLSESQMQVLQQREQNASVREQQIIQIARDCNELAEMFKNLSVLVIQQGTILDRIDYQVEQTVVQLKAAKSELVIAEKHQKKNKTTLCIMILVVCIGIAALILIFRQSGNDSG